MTTVATYLKYLQDDYALHIGITILLLHFEPQYPTVGNWLDSQHNVFEPICFTESIQKNR